MRHAIAALLLVALAAAPALAQSGSTGGSIGKTNKEISGGEPAPARSVEKPARKPAAGGCGRFTGTWSWPMGTTTFHADHTQQHTMGNTGTWSCAGATIVAKWVNGHTDRITLDPDGTTAEVKSTFLNMQFTIRKQ